MATLTDNQVLSRISKFYHDDFQQARSLLQPDENITWAGNHAYGLSSELLCNIGYLLLTSYRGIQISFDVGIGLFGRGKIRIRKEWEIPDLPTYPLTRKEKESRNVKEALLRNISQATRNDYKVKVQDREIVLIELNIGQSGVGGLVGLTLQS